MRRMSWLARREHRCGNAKSRRSEDPQYLTQAIKAYRTTRKHALMSRLVADLSDQDIDNIVAFYTTQKSKPAEDGQNLLKDITDKCNRCHAGDINNPALAIPIINGQDKDYLMLALRAYRDGKRGNSHDAQHERALQRLHHREHCVLLREPAGEIGMKLGLRARQCRCALLTRP